MRTTVTLDDGLMADAIEFSGIKEKSALLNAVLKAYVERAAARELARMGGSDPTAEAGPRKRYWEA